MRASKSPVSALSAFPDRPLSFGRSRSSCLSLFLPHTPKRKSLTKLQLEASPVPLRAISSSLSSRPPAHGATNVGPGPRPVDATRPTRSSKVRSDSVRLLRRRRPCLPLQLPPRHGLLPRAPRKHPRRSLRHRQARRARPSSRTGPPGRREHLHHDGAVLRSPVRQPPLRRPVRPGRDTERLRRRRGAHGLCRVRGDAKVARERSRGVGRRARGVAGGVLGGSKEGPLSSATRSQVLSENMLATNPKSGYACA